MRSRRIHLNFCTRKPRTDAGQVMDLVRMRISRARVRDLRRGRAGRVELS